MKLDQSDTYSKAPLLSLPRLTHGVLQGIKPDWREKCAVVQPTSIFDTKAHSNQAGMQQATIRDVLKVITCCLQWPSGIVIGTNNMALTVLLHGKCKLAGNARAVLSSL
jgi:hypothetical protein